MKRRSSTKWLAVIGLVGAVGIGATVGIVDAAGASSGTTAGGSRAASSPATTVSFRFSASISGVSSSPVTVTGSGQADLASHQAALEVDIPALVAKLLPGGSASPEVVKAVLFGGTVYVEIPSLASTVGAPWISISLPAKATSAIPGIFSKVATALGNVNSILEFAEAHHATVSSLGSATVDDVEAEGSKIVAKLSPKGGSHTLTVSVWADAAGRLVQATVTASGSGNKANFGLTATVDFTGYGLPVTITAPPPSKVKAIPLSTIQMFLGDHRGAHPVGLHTGIAHSWSAHTGTTRAGIAHAWSAHTGSAHSWTSHGWAAHAWAAHAPSA